MKPWGLKKNKNKANICDFDWYKKKKKKKMCERWEEQITDFQKFWKIKVRLAGRH